jgi:tetrahydromethanopterin S-methyltransferase subunit A
LEQVVPTYIEKIKRGKKDRFIKQDDLKDVVMRDDKGKLTDVNKELSKTLKLSGIKEREKLIAQLDKWLGQSDVKTPFSGGLNPEIRKVLSRLGEDYDTFMGLNNRQMKDRMRGIVKELSSEIKRLKYSEFRRYQQKWMAEFNNN